MQNSKFDPRTLGATPVGETPKAFDPSSLGAQKIEPLQPKIPGYVDRLKEGGKEFVKTALDVTGGDPNVRQMGVPALDLAIGGAATTAVQAPKVLANLPSLVKQSPAGQIAKSGTQAVSGAVKAFMDKPREATSAMTKALKPLSTNLQFKDNIGRALPEIKATETALGKPIESVEDLAKGIKLAKRKVWSEYEAMLGPNAAKMVDGSPIADAIIKTIPGKLRLQNPAAAAKIEELANTYRRNFSIAELDDFLGTSNAELASYYAKYPAARTTAQNANPEIAQNVAEAESLRDVIYKAIDSSGGGDAAREIKRRYGSLMNMEKEVQRRLNVAARQNPDSLSEQMSKWHAAYQIGKGIVTLSPGEIVGAIASSKVASAIKQANTSDALIANVFRNYKPQPKP